MASDYLIESDWMNGGMFKENDANTDPSNPPHGSPLGQAFDLKMNALSSGETKRMTLTVSAEAYSIGQRLDGIVRRADRRRRSGRDPVGARRGGGHLYGARIAQGSPSIDVIEAT